MRKVHSSRRQIEMDAVDLDFDFFADTTGLAGDVTTAVTFGGLANLADLFTEIAEFDRELELIEAELLAHEARHAADDALVPRLQVGETSMERGWAA
ncbi:hypothetical protein SAMN04489729_4235 [Amycolatopsis lurida]|uniref:Uncharacterized protein n=1 Tax=Amycolatopsis lurida NRRL 2430 TaxID=1460371 RepID=A0A2P2G1T0_AMYLU|nr:hypothetical protein [Amycolatopsis lurida]KFU82933.1 hypothetical protein BB31_00130 [Amycolatopsis lurida NRRL 2430]SED39817.1 hypothetical protein SAMN04489729_4235 [Amycolatopsis lurida]